MEGRNLRATPTPQRDTGTGGGRSFPVPHPPLSLLDWRGALAEHHSNGSSSKGSHASASASPNGKGAVRDEREAVGADESDRQNDGQLSLLNAAMGRRDHFQRAVSTLDPDAIMDAVAPAQFGGHCVTAWLPEEQVAVELHGPYQYTLSTDPNQRPRLNGAALLKERALVAGGATLVSVGLHEWGGALRSSGDGGGAARTIERDEHHDAAANADGGHRRRSLPPSLHWCRFFRFCLWIGRSRALVTI